MSGDEGPPTRTNRRVPPHATRFRKGQSGNPKGRPKGSRREAPYESVLGQIVTIREGGVERQVAATEAFLLNLAKQGMEGNSFAATVLAKTLEEARNRAIIDRSEGVGLIVRQIVSPGSVVHALEPLRMARMLDEFRDSAKLLLEPWIVEAALERLGEKRLNFAQQTIVVRATHHPHKVRWPVWWEVR